MKCPKCGKSIDPVQHGDLTFDDQVWCADCHQYDGELFRHRDFAELENWALKICAAFGQEPVALQQNLKSLTNPRIYWQDSTFVLAEADHQQRSILLYPPGYRLPTLCHELAHIFTGQDHTEAWARTFAKLVAWVKTQL
ncbi:MAG: hypothetical protein PHW74_04500 [Desulfobacca sp.]|nr:hypothetical protein [Desulfobacca sp.]